MPSCEGTAEYAGGGLGARSPGCEFCLGGSLGGRFCFGFVAALCGEPPPTSSPPLTGGGGNPDFDNPVVFARYGTGGGADFLAAASSFRGCQGLAYMLSPPDEDPCRLTPDVGLLEDTASP